MYQEAAMLKEYEWRGSTWQFEESQAPKDAVPVKAADTASKAKEPQKNKERRAVAKK